MGPRLGVANRFGVLQFVWDFNMWSTLVAKKQLQPNISLRIKLRGYSFTPQYWKHFHHVLTNFVDQVGPTEAVLDGVPIPMVVSVPRKRPG